jgi:nicotinamidase-related amidase
VNSVIRLRDYFTEQRVVFVLVDLHDDGTPESEALDSALANCRVALTRARTAGIPVAFVRRLTMDAPPSWRSGFAPRRDDMLFERSAHSCYASKPFGDMAEATGGNLVLAGLFAETSCIATVIDASNRGHQVIWLADASASCIQHGCLATNAHDPVATILALHCQVSATEAWVARMRAIRVGG